MTNELDVCDQQVVNLVNELKQEKISFRNIPHEYKSHPAIIKALMEMGMCKMAQRGYDVIRGNFFVENVVTYVNFMDDIVEKTLTVRFANFFDYYVFLGGDIYENACYYKYTFSKEDIEKYSIDLSRITTTSAIDYKLDDFTLDFTAEELNSYIEKEKDKKFLKKWIKKLNDSKDCAEFKKVLERFTLSKFSNTPIKFLIFNYIFSDKGKAFDIAMQYINTSASIGLEKSMCLIYEPSKVLFSYNPDYYSSIRARYYKQELEAFATDLFSKKINFHSRSYFDEKINYFVYQRFGVSELKRTRRVELLRYFETFSQLADFLHNDLTNCDLTKAIIPELDLSQYKMDSTTKLPIQYQTNLRYTVNKYYDKKDDCFVVTQEWTNEDGTIIKSYRHDFKFFADFAKFLNYDLSNCDLLFCDGLNNITDYSGLNLDNARIKSSVADKLGMRYEIAFNGDVECLPAIQQNEEDTLDAYAADREEYGFDNVTKCQKIYYISDLHLLHRLKIANCKSNNDIVYTVQQIIDGLLDSIKHLEKNIVLIGGDTSSEFALFKMFVEMIRASMDERRMNVSVIFTLGNHEMWEFAGESLDEIVTKYQQVLEDNGMYLLQNNIIAKHDNGIDIITTNELKNASQKELKNRLVKARIILFGGIGFAGYNDKFNADLSIYRQTLDRKKEIAQTQQFEDLYNKVCSDLSDKRVIVFTHMPQKDWCFNATPHSGFVYVSGHTHRNYFNDDGEYRIYADNQIGYKSASVRLKHFYVDDDYDIFIDYTDGIHQISREKYQDFYRGKNMMMNFNRDFHRLYMLKKNGYYMFILQNYHGKLLLLNGGAVKNLKQNNVEYYFDKMDKMVSTIKSPLDKFSEYLKRISNEIKAIGGSGTIHGSIVDIDFFNHVYVNPIDLKVTAYCATDIVRKVVFKDVPSLLQASRPELYQNYLKLLESKPTTAVVLRQTKNTDVTDAPVYYLDTDIYRASREINKMQKLNLNILSIWNDALIDVPEISCNEGLEI